MYLSRSDVLRARARRLRREAARAPLLLAVAYRRRASELELLAAITAPAPEPAGVRAAA
jgi:hypothetical protein